MPNSNLITTWLAVETAMPGRTMADALRDMNQALGRDYRQSRLREWERGERLPDVYAMEYMVSRIIVPILLDEGLNKVSAKRISTKLALPHRI